MVTIAERFCARHSLPRARFDRTVLVRSLSFQAQLLYPILRFVPGYFDADLELIRYLGGKHEIRDFTGECADFHQHPANTLFLRRALKLRTSTRKLRRTLCRGVAD